ncbi:apolipoprotein N-acyltransferase [Prolixibacter bellariivorans]|uniref:Apolipoprotein N-acyltransferase n=1 Tax=Prolixibacter bellariivorans TaxID=314319 RepID=A0A5M4B2M6_9BACT|nr:nitrilase-related carbon-nitrogen hydrolase [Prolixibacter bellariivorans]GET34334.1 apolipoprotein N-acyltransferase [Prolixibacter bellariivorans]
MKSNSLTKDFLLLLAGFTGMIGFGLNWHMAIAAWLTPLFLLAFIRSTKVWGFLLFFLSSVVAGSISRTCFVMNGMLSEHIANGLFFGVGYTVPYLIDRLLYRKQRGFYTTLIFPAAFVAIEYLVALILGTWGSVAHTQYNLLPFMQIISVTGLFGLTFLVSWFGAVINWVFENREHQVVIRRGMWIYAIVFLLVFLFGDIRLSFFSPQAETVKVAAITGDTDIQKVMKDESETFQQYKKQGNFDIPDRIFSNNQHIENMLDRTRQATNAGAKIIAWNEISLILNRHQVESLLSQVKSIALARKVYILTAFLEQSSPSSAKPFNNKSVLIQPDGQVGWEYLKSALHPTAEAPIINPGNFRIPTVITQYGRLGNVICYDMEFPRFIRQAGKQNVDIMLVPSFDWPGITPLHAEMASFEAIQNGFSLLRPNGQGLSAAFDYQGRVLAQMNTLTTDSKIMYADLPIKSATTISPVVGDLLVFLSVLYLFFILGTTVSKRRKKTKI